MSAGPFVNGMGGGPSPGRVPCPREAWRAAVDGRDISVTVQTPGSTASVDYSGTITEVLKDGNEFHSHVILRFVPDGELAAMELEAERDRNGWGPFRAFSWKRPQRPGIGDGAHRFMFVGRVTDMDIPGIRWNTEDESGGESSA